MGSVGDAYDNAMCESFFGSLEKELIDRRSFRNHAEARMAVFRYIEGWYNPRRRHSGIDYNSPNTTSSNTRRRLDHGSRIHSLEPGQLQSYTPRDSVPLVIPMGSKAQTFSV